MTKKIGIIGFGEMGKRHGLEFREATKGNIEICGVVEPDDMMYQRGCEWNGNPDIPRLFPLSGSGSAVPSNWSGFSATRRYTMRGMTF